MSEHVDKLGAQEALDPGELSLSFTVTVVIVPEVTGSEASRENSPPLGWVFILCVASVSRLDAPTLSACPIMP